MISKELLDLLVCPVDHSPLSVADAALIQRLNQAIASGRLKNQAGQTLDKAIDGGLVRADRTVLYPITDGIPIMLIDEAILLAQLDDAAM